MKMLYQGHASCRFTLDDGRILYLDPYAGEGYDKKADVVLITHGHFDHNKIELVPKKEECVVITNKEALKGSRHNAFSLDGIEVEAVYAANDRHDPNECVGFLIQADGVLVYASGDTSKTRQMEELARRKIDYAMFCCDGKYNMDLEEAAECAKIVGARHNIPVHISAEEIFDINRAKAWSAPDKLILTPGREIEL